MKKYVIILAVIILFAPSALFSDIATFKVGYFIPQAKSDLWEIEFDQMSFNKSSFQATNFGFSYEYFVANEASIIICIDGYSKQKLGIYEGFDAYVDLEGDFYAFENEPGGDVVSHVFNVSITPIQLGIKFTPFGRKSKIIPYVGGGVGLYLWNVRLYGDLVDFDDPVEFTDGSIGFPIYETNAREENKFKVGYHAFGGVMVPIANRISADLEFKYNFVKGNFTEAFVGFEPFDLSSYQISLGVNYWF
jgi:opacity protein-like surface antigen